MNTVEHGPLQEGGMITAGLDYYKPTMSQVLYEQERDTEVTFTFKNRGEQRLEDHIDVSELQQRFDDIQARGFTPAELEHLGEQRLSTGEPVFSADFLNYLWDNLLPRVEVAHDEEMDDLAITATGPAALVTFWETIIMSEVNEQYFESYVRDNNIDIMALYDEGERRLQDKIAILQEHSDIQFSDFGTRRHFSTRWQKHVLQRLQDDCPNNITGTSNVGLANTLDLQPIGTFAHEMPMVYAALADARGENILDSHNKFLQTWESRYGEDLSIALTDTFGTDFFFEDFTREQATTWRGMRHDSGDPYDFAEKVLAFYEAYDIDPTEKTIVFSDGLDIDQIVKLHETFKGRVNIMFGWGTTLTNDLGIPALNIVAKATHVRTADDQEAGTVKISDNPGKLTGKLEDLQEYKHEINARHFGRLATSAA